MTLPKLGRLVARYREEVDRAIEAETLSAADAEAADSEAQFTTHLVDFVNHVGSQVSADLLRLWAARLEQAGIEPATPAAVEAAIPRAKHRPRNSAQNDAWALLGQKFRKAHVVDGMSMKQIARVELGPVSESPERLDTGRKRVAAVLKREDTKIRKAIRRALETAFPKEEPNSKNK